MNFVELVDQIELPALFIKRCVFVADIFDERIHRCDFGVDAHTLEDSGEKCGLPVGTSTRRRPARSERNVTWHVLVLSAQPIKHP